MQREAAREPCTDSAHPMGPAISIREHHLSPPPHPCTLHCVTESKNNLLKIDKPCITLPICENALLATQEILVLDLYNHSVNSSFLMGTYH